MFSAINCFARARVQPLGGETLLIVSSDSPDASLVGDAYWEEGCGPTSSVAALNLSRAGAAVEVVEGEGVPLGSETYTLTAWLELPLTGGKERTLAGCGPLDEARGSSAVLEEITEEDEEWSAAVCVSSDGELGVRRERLEDFAGSGFFVDDLQPGWYHVAAVAELGATRFAVNGRPVGSSAAVVGAGSRLRRLGARPRTDASLSRSDECWGGRLADIRLFDRPLDTDEISVLFSSGPFSSAAANAPQLPPKSQRAERAARARLLESTVLVDDALQMLEAATDLIRTGCLDAIPDLQRLLDILANDRDAIAAAVFDACAQHKLRPKFTPRDSDLRRLLATFNLPSETELFLIYFGDQPPETPLGLPLVLGDDKVAAAVLPPTQPALLICDARTAAVIHTDALSDLKVLGPHGAKEAWASLVPNADE